MMAKRTNEYFKNRTSNPSDVWYDKRYFILTRSTYTTTGNYASHWLGDNYREYAYMNYSIAGVMNMNMFGIPHVGADICGFFGDARDDPLCAKWAQLGTYYPFARFHYDTNSTNNEPYLMAEPYKSIVRRTMLDRYQHLRQLYTCLRDAQNQGGTCFDPLFYHFPNDTKLYNEIESSFLFVGSIKVTPNLQNSSEQSIPAYFPDANGKWVSLVNLREALDGGQTHELDTTGYSTPAHLMPGRVIAF
jgi:alpha-glucosidase (family GH31 glycosyl hydrolase)